MKHWFSLTLVKELAIAGRNGPIWRTTWYDSDTKCPTSFINTLCLKVTRKRRRYAVDPCLGYYIYALKNTGEKSAAFTGTQPHSTDSHKDVVPTSVDAEREIERPCALMDYTTNDALVLDVSPATRASKNPNYEMRSDQKVLTVEAFLKQTPSRRAIKTRTYRKKRKMQPANEERRDFKLNADERFFRPETISNDEGDGISLTKPERKIFRAKRRMLKERLYAAAVSTSGDPDVYYSNSCAANGMVESNRLPLHFLPFSQIHPLERRMHCTSKSLLVDPRKSAAIQKARFTCRNHILRESNVLTNTPDLMPISKWNHSLKIGGHIHKSASEMMKKQKQRLSTGDMVLEITCPPLAFVSFQEAEEKYETMFSSRWYVCVMQIPLDSDVSYKVTKNEFAWSDLPLILIFSFSQNNWKLRPQFRCLECSLISICSRALTLSAFNHSQPIQ